MSLIGWLTASVSDTTMALVEDGALLGPRQLDMGNSGLVNNAAHWEAPDDIVTTSAGSIDRHFEVNTRAAVLLIVEYVKRYRSRNGRWGRVVNISTDCAQVFGRQISNGIPLWGMTRPPRPGMLG